MVILKSLKKGGTKMKYWIEWVAIYENFTYSEAVSEKELTDRLSDNSIRVTLVEPLE